MSQYLVGVVGGTGGIGTVTSITAGTGITLTPGPITTTGSVALTVPVVIANGGTNATTFATTDGTVYFDGTRLVTTATGTAGQVLTSNGVGVAPTYQAGGGGGSTTYVYTNVNTTPYVVLNADQFLSVDSSGSAIQVNLPNAPTTGRFLIIKDRTGNAVVNNITVTTVGGAVLIDGATTFVMNTNYESIQVLFNGTSYEVY